MANPNHRLAMGITVACSLIAASLFLIPAWIIQPFRAQAQDQLALALAVRQLAPVATLVRQPARRPAGELRGGAG